MANEASYAYTAPGGVVAKPRAANLRRYKSPEEVTHLDDFVTFGDMFQTIKDNAVLFLVGGAAVGLVLAYATGQFKE